MATIGTAIVREVLNGDNYIEWSVTMKSYLQSIGLWDSLTEDVNNYRVDNLFVDMKNNSVKLADISKLSWKRKDAAALHAIHVSCNSETFSRIKDAKSATEAWNNLEMLYSGQLLADIDDIEQGVIENHELMHLRKHIYSTEDWNKILKFMGSNREAVISKTSSNRTVVHMAVIAGRVDIIDKLINKVPQGLLLDQDTKGLTALALAACLTDNQGIVKPMVKKEPKLLTIKDNDGLIPVVLASEKGQKKMTQYLYDATFNNPENLRLLEDHSEHRALLFVRCIREEIFDIALDLLKHYDNSFLSVTFDGIEGHTPLFALAQNASVFPSGSPEIPLYGLQVWKYKSKKRLRAEQKLMHDQVDQILKFLSEKVSLLSDKELSEYSIYNAMLEASKYGNFEFIVCMTSVLPQLFSVIDGHRRGIFSYAIINRHIKVFNLIHNLKERKDGITSRVDVFGNTLLHLAAAKGPTSELARECGPAMQMQTEYQWLQAVKNIVHPKCVEIRNNDEETPRELFIRSHEQLVKDGESWAKSTAKSYTIVAALITTIMFAAAFTVPGGYNQTTGIPLLLDQHIFALFIIADLVSLFASAMSVLVFIGIMNSRFTEIDFLRSLPTMLLVGISAILIAVLTMMVAFMAALRTVLRGYLETFVIVFFPLVSLPFLFHVKEQFLPIIGDIYSNTYHSELDILNIRKGRRNADS